jgi:SAM-dependent methyltransferase
MDCGAVVLLSIVENDILGSAVSDRYFGHSPARLWVYDTLGPRVEMDVSVYFRGWPEMPLLEQIALQECGPRVLDIGAGAGSHALELQARGRDVTALDISPLNVSVMKARGVGKAIAADVFAFSKGRYDTLLLLMNGIGLVGDVDGLRRFLRHAKTLLLPGGQLLFDSSDVAYLYEESPMPAERYYGEIRCRYGYKRRKTDWFSWLYIDFGTLQSIAAEEGWKPDLLFEDGNDQYLVRLRLA